MKIAFFGASTVQQENSYADAFAYLRPKDRIKKFGFGGMHINNAGICFIDKVANWKPDLCFIDWFCTDYVNQDNEVGEYIKTINNKLNSVNSKIVFLFLPHNDFDKNRLDFYENTKLLLKKYGVEFLCLDDLLVNVPVVDLVRDRIHTTKKGSELYASEIDARFDKFKIITNRQFETTKYENIKSLSIKKVFHKGFKLEGNCRIVGITQKVGPFSGIILIKNPNEDKEFLVWDKWCYYTRTHFTITADVCKTAEIHITNKQFDTSECNYKFNFTRINKKLVLDTLYYIGESLHYEKLFKNDGSSGSFYIMKLREFVGYYKHQIKKTIKRLVGKNMEAV